MKTDTTPVLAKLNDAFFEYSKDAISRDGGLYTIRAMEKHATIMSVREATEITNTLINRYNSFSRFSGERRAMEPYVKMVQDAWGGKKPVLVLSESQIIEKTSDLLDRLNAPTKIRTYRDHPIQAVVKAKKDFAEVRRFFHNRVSI